MPFLQGNAEVEARGLTRRTTVFGTGAAIPGLPTHMARSYALLAWMVAIVIGLLAGVVPASRAARMDPVTALRSE